MTRMYVKNIQTKVLTKIQMAVLILQNYSSLSSIVLYLSTTENFDEWKITIFMPILLKKLKKVKIACDGGFIQIPFIGKMRINLKICSTVFVSNSMYKVAYLERIG